MLSGKIFKHLLCKSRSLGVIGIKICKNRTMKISLFSCLTLFKIGGGSKKTHTSFSSVISTNVRINLHKLSNF